MHPLWPTGVATGAATGSGVGSGIGSGSGTGLALAKNPLRGHDAVGLMLMQAFLPRS